jgi:hypothetical protein
MATCSQPGQFVVLEEHLEVSPDAFHARVQGVDDLEGDRQQHSSGSSVATGSAASAAVATVSRRRDTDERHEDPRRPAVGSSRSALYSSSSRSVVMCLRGR